MPIFRNEAICNCCEKEFTFDPYLGQYITAIEYAANLNSLDQEGWVTNYSTPEHDAVELVSELIETDPNRELDLILMIGLGNTLCLDCQG